MRDFPAKFMIKIMASRSQYDFFNSLHKKTKAQFDQTALPSGEDQIAIDFTSLALNTPTQGGDITYVRRIGELYITFDEEMRGFYVRAYADGCLGYVMGLIHAYLRLTNSRENIVFAWSQGFNSNDITTWPCPVAGVAVINKHIGVTESMLEATTRLLGKIIDAKLISDHAFQEEHFR